MDQTEPYLRYDVQPHQLVCPHCGESKDFNIVGKTLEEVSSFGNAFNQKHKNGRCKLNEGDFIIKNNAVEIKLCATGDIMLNGRTIETDQALVAGLRKLLHGS